MLATTTQGTPAKAEFEPLNFILFLAIVLAATVGIPLYGISSDSAFSIGCCSW